MDDNDHDHQAIGREEIKANLCKIIEDKIGDGYIICEADGHLYDIDFEEELHGKFYDNDSQPWDCYPASTRRSTRDATQKSRQCKHKA